MLLREKVPEGPSVFHAVAELVPCGASPCMVLGWLPTPPPPPPLPPPRRAQKVRDGLDLFASPPKMGPRSERMAWTCLPRPPCLGRFASILRVLFVFLDTSPKPSEIWFSFGAPARKAFYRIVFWRKRPRRGDVNQERGRNILRGDRGPCMDARLTDGLGDGRSVEGDRDIRLMGRGVQRGSVRDVSRLEG